MTKNVDLPWIEKSGQPRSMPRPPYVVEWPFEKKKNRKHREAINEDENKFKYSLQKMRDPVTITFMAKARS